MQSNNFGFNSTDSVFTKSQKLYLLLGLLFSGIGLIADTISYFENGNRLLLSINLASFGLILFFSMGYIFKKTSQKLTAAVMVYSIIVNILISNVYLFLQTSADWQLYFLRGSIVIAIFISIATLLLNKTHIIIINILYSTALFTISLLSKESNFISRYALFLSLLMAGFSYSINKFIMLLKSSIEEKKQIRNLLIKKEKEVLLKENELTKAKARHLEERLLYKNKELVTKALIIAKDAEYKKKLTDQLQKLLRLVNPEAENELLNILSDISVSEKSLHWPEFYKRFGDVHQDFYKKISTATPGLTPSELKLAAFIKLGFSSKEISLLTQNSTSSIEVARSRLRKKMRLRPSDNFMTYLSKF